MRTRLIAVVVTPAVLISAPSLRGQSRATNTGGPNVQVPGTASAAATTRYVGSETCKKCHLAIEDRDPLPGIEASSKWKGSLLEHLHHELRLYVGDLLQRHLQCRTILIGSFVENPFESEGRMVQQGLG